MSRTIRFFSRVSAIALLLAAAWLAWVYRPASPQAWTDSEKVLLKSMSLDSLPPLPADATNAVADNPDAVILGNRLFFDTRLSGNREISCAICHQPDRRFTDGLAKGHGIGVSKRNTRSIVGVAYSPWLYWDGRRDSLWAQALSPMEDPNEHGTQRMQVVRLVTGEPAYRQMYEELFGTPPDFSDRSRFPEAAAPFGQYAAAWNSMRLEDRRLVNRVFSNIGKAIAAYERTLVPERTRFDDYVDAVVADDLGRQRGLFSDDEVLGLQLFVGKARCTECHNGPLFTNGEFHNTGVAPYPRELPDRGRIDGVRTVLANEFNCLGDYSDDPEHRCQELEFVRTGPELIGAMRTPTLRGITRTAPYMHKGQIETLSEVLEHYNRPEAAMIGHNEAQPLSLNRVELSRLEDFLRTLEPAAAATERAGD